MRWIAVSKVIIYLPEVEELRTASIRPLLPDQKL